MSNIPTPRSDIFSVVYNKHINPSTRQQRCIIRTQGMVVKGTESNNFRTLLFSTLYIFCREKLDAPILTDLVVQNSILHCC